MKFGIITCVAGRTRTRKKKKSRTTEGGKEPKRLGTKAAKLRMRAGRYILSPTPQNDKTRLARSANMQRLSKDSNSNESRGRNKQERRN